MRRNIGLALLMGGAIWLTTVASAGQHITARADRAHPLSIVIEEGMELAEALVLGFPELDGQIVVEIEAGGAEFGSGAARGFGQTIRNGVIVLPPILPGEVDDESWVRLRSGGRLVEQLRIATVPRGTVELLLAQVSDRPQALLLHGPGYAVVNEGELAFTFEQMQIGRVDHLADSALTESVADAVIFELKDPVPAQVEGIPCGSEPCTRTPFGPGRVNWLTPNPWLFGYSVKPESVSGALVMAQAPSQAIDGVYRRSWGCNMAFKVPDSCTLEADDILLSCCCNATMYLLGHKCKVIEPGALSDWPDCPL